MTTILAGPCVGEHPARDSASPAGFAVAGLPQSVRGAKLVAV